MANSTKLAVILHADVVGSTDLVRRDERLAHDSIQRTFHRMSALISAGGGVAREIRGDAIVAEFDRASDAAKVAIEFQDENRLARGRDPERLQPVVRVGIALGEVVIADETITGLGVILAQRLEQLAPAGGVCISSAVREAIPDRMGFSYRGLGTKQVKGFDNPLHAYLVLGPRQEADPATLPGEDAAGQESRRPDHRASIAVLSFENMSGDPEQEYFSDGIAADVITALSKLSGLFVIARNSSFSYKGRAVNVQQVAQELGVDHVLEGSIRKSGSRVRVSVQLIDGRTGGATWADRYDRELEDIFAVQDELTGEIVKALDVKLSSGERRRMQHRGAESLEAYDCYLRGRGEVWRFSAASWKSGRAVLERAIALDPRLSPAYSELAIGYVLEFVNQWTADPETSKQRALEFALKARRLDDTNPSNYVALSIIHRWNGDLDQALADVRQAIELDPNSAYAYSVYARTLHFAGQGQEALEKIETAMALDPYYPDLWLHFQGEAYFMLERFEEAAISLQRRLLRYPMSDISRALLASTLGHLGRFDAARAQWAELMHVNPDYSLDHRRQILPYKNAADFQRIVDGLAKAGLPN